MQETRAGKTITLQHCWASIKAHDMFDCSSVVFNGGEAFLFVHNGVTDAHVSLPWNHCFLKIQRNSLLSAFISSKATWILQGPCSTLTLLSKNTSTNKASLKKKRGTHESVFTVLKWSSKLTPTVSPSLPHTHRHTL